MTLNTAGQISNCKSVDQMPCMCRISVVKWASGSNVVLKCPCNFSENDRKASRLYSTQLCAKRTRTQVAYCKGAVHPYCTIGKDMPNDLLPITISCIRLLCIISFSPDCPERFLVYQACLMLGIFIILRPLVHLELHKKINTVGSTLQPNRLPPSPQTAIHRSQTDCPLKAAQESRCTSLAS